MMTPPSSGTGFRLKVMFAVEYVMTMFTSIIRAIKLSMESPRLVRAPPLVVVKFVRLLTNW